VPEHASIIIVTYNHRRYLEALIGSILRQRFPFEIIMIDNRSTDGTAAFVRERFPSVILHENTENLGFGAGNNLGSTLAHGEYLVFLNPDVIVEDGWLEALLAPLQNRSCTVTTPMILLYDGRTVNTCGNLNHFTGLTFTRGLGEDPSRCRADAAVTGISGACFALRAEHYRALGGFDTHFFVYNEDSELSWRMHYQGFSICLVPPARIRHDYTLKISPEKLYHLEKGRYIILRKFLRPKEALLLGPSLLLAELMSAGFALKLGKNGVAAKVRALREGLRGPVEPMQGRGREILVHLSPVIPTDQLTSNIVERTAGRVANVVFSANYRIVRRLLQ
jgi:GT2 family glycosyltransferase